MTENQSLAEKVYEIVQSARSGEIDPLEIRLTEPYRELQELVEKLDSRLDIDEMLNEVLGAKVNRVQELARVLASPEVYVARLKGKSTYSFLDQLTRASMSIPLNIAEGSGRWHKTE